MESPGDPAENWPGRLICSGAGELQEAAGAGRRRIAPMVWIAIGTAAGVSLWLLLKTSKESVSPTTP